MWVGKIPWRRKWQPTPMLLPGLFHRVAQSQTQLKQLSTAQLILAPRTPWIVGKSKKIWHQKMSSPSLVVVQYATGEEQRESSRKNEEAGQKQKWHPDADVSGGESKVQCCTEQYCIGTWKVRSMNQGELEIVKQEMLRVNINSLGISKLKWTGLCEFNSDGHYIYYCGQEFLRRSGVAIIVNKRV